MRGLEDLAPDTGEDLVEAPRVLGVTVSENEPDCDAGVIEVGRYVSGLLGHP
jgi:hypothetical protein